MECAELWNTYTNLKLKYRVAATSKARPDDSILMGLSRACDEAQRALRQHELTHNPGPREAEPQSEPSPSAAPQLSHGRTGVILLPAAAVR
jgi:hypothetical protein